MKALYIGSTAKYSGKSLITIGLAQKLKKDGYRVGFFKPLGKPAETGGPCPVDCDAQFMAKMLDLSDPLEAISPVVLTHDLIASGLRGEVEGLRQRTKDAFRVVSEGKDVVLIGGSRGLSEGAFLGISGLTLIKALDVPVLLVDPYREEVCVDCLISAKEALGDRLKGAVLNRVPVNGLDYVKQTIIPFLEGRGVDVMGALPHDTVLDSIPISQLNEVLGGRVLCCEDKMEEFVERFSVGAMDVDSALHYFRKTPNKAVITGGFRADIQTAALETSTRCLILTGDQMPNDIIIGRAVTAGVPILLVRHDTLTTVERVEAVMGKTRIRAGAKLDRALEMMDRHFDYERLCRTLGLGR